MSNDKPPQKTASSCELCAAAQENILWQNDQCRVILVDDVNYPGFCRVIWNSHIKEMTDLPEELRIHVMHVVFAVEKALRQVLHPDKINLASLGNMTPHLHWHVIPRFNNDLHFPNPIWAAPQRTLGETVRPHGAPEQLSVRLSSELQSLMDENHA